MFSLCYIAFILQEQEYKYIYALKKHRIGILFILFFGLVMTVINILMVTVITFQNKFNKFGFNKYKQM